METALIFKGQEQKKTQSRKGKTDYKNNAIYKQPRYRGDSTYTNNKNKKQKPRKNQMDSRKQEKR